MAQYPFVEQADRVAQVFSAYIKTGETVRVGAPVKLSSNFVNGALPEIVETTANTDIVIGVIETDDGWSPAGTYPHQGNNTYHLNPNRRIITVRRLFGIGLVRLVGTIAKGARVVAGSGGVVTIPSLGSTTPIMTLGQLLEGGVSGDVKPIFLDKGITLI